MGARVGGDVKFTSVIVAAGARLAASCGFSCACKSEAQTRKKTAMTKATFKRFAVRSAWLGFDDGRDRVETLESECCRQNTVPDFFLLLICTIFPPRDLFQSVAKQLLKTVLYVPARNG